ncbi:uncharacterized protein BJ212DRAFT_1420084, partial [Suillus subaureus]
PARNTLHHTFPGARSADVLASALRNVLTLINGVMVSSSATAAIHDHFLPCWCMPKIAVLRCSVECCERSSSYTSSDIACELLFTWVRGKDRLIFESFTGHVSRKVTSTLQEFGDVI